MLQTQSELDRAWALDRIAFARQELSRGGPSAAFFAAAEAVHRYPDDAELLRQASAIHLEGEDFPQALAYLLRADAVAPGQPETIFAMAELERASERNFAAKACPAAALRVHLATAVAARAEGRHRDALALLEGLRGNHPQDPAFHTALADLYIYHNDRANALSVLEEAVVAGIANPTVDFLLLSLLNETGAYSALIRHAQGMAVATARDRPAALLGAHANLAQLYDRPAIVAAATQREAMPGWLPADQVMRCLRSAIAERRPFAFSRYGDGEGRFLVYTDPSCRLASADRVAIGNSIWQNWFAGDITEIRPNELAWLRAEVLTAVQRADLIGLSDAHRLAVDGAHFGYLAYFDQLVAARVAAEPMLNMCDALVHLELHRLSPFYGRLLHGLDFIGVISPHPELAERLARHLSIPRWVAYNVPGEQRLPVDARGGGGHFPAVYRDLLARLNVPRRGAVFLVAAGLLGKVYCDRIRQRGGIAIDVGSVVDGWMGFNTRPGALDDQAAWALPS